MFVAEGKLGDLRFDAGKLHGLAVRELGDKGKRPTQGFNRAAERRNVHVRPLLNLRDLLLRNAKLLGHLDLRNLAGDTEVASVISLPVVQPIAF